MRFSSKKNVADLLFSNYIFFKTKLNKPARSLEYFYIYNFSEDVYKKCKLLLCIIHCSQFAIDGMTNMQNS